MRRPGSEALGWITTLLLAWVVAWPMLLLVGEAFGGPGGAAAPVAEFMGTPTSWRALANSVWLSLASAAGAVAVGVPLAWLVARYALPGRRALAWLLAMPVALPPLVGVLAFLFLCGESGFLAHLVRAVLRLEEAPWRFQGWAAILLVHVYATYPFVFLLARAGLGTLDAALLEAATGLGAGRARVARHVLLPALAPAIAGGGLLAFMTSLASFSAPYLFGGGTRVLTTQIVSSRLNGDDARAMVETLALAAVALTALGVFRVLDPPEARAASGRATRPLPRRPAGPLLGALAWTLALALVLPHLTLLLVSFVPRGTWTTEALPPVLSAGNYLVLLRDPVRFRPMVNSLWMATLATAGAVALATLGGWLALRRGVATRGVLTALLALPWAVPGTVFAVALATAFAKDDPWTARVVLIGTPWLLPLAWLVRDLPLTSRAVLARFRRLDPALDEAAAALGAGPWRTLRRVTLPLLAPALMAGGALAFVTAFGDFVTSIVLYSYETRPVSLEILASLRQSDVGVAAAYGLVLTVVSAAVFALDRPPEEAP
ncbi:MAG: iron ABC transporter permease [Gemmatimonadales bacterium]|nr:iron ABC transporter permease [Gemmatimonadales bacterium]